MLPFQQEVEHLVVELHARGSRRSPLLEQECHQRQVERVAGELRRGLVTLDGDESSRGAADVGLAVPAEPAREERELRGLIQVEQLDVAERRRVRATVADGAAGHEDRRPGPAGGEIADQRLGVVALGAGQLVETVQQDEQPSLLPLVLERGGEAFAAASVCTRAFSIRSSSAPSLRTVAGNAA